MKANIYNLYISKNAHGTYIIPELSSSDIQALKENRNSYYYVSSINIDLDGRKKTHGMLDILKELKNKGLIDYDNNQLISPNVTVSDDFYRLAEPLNLKGAQNLVKEMGYLPTLEIEL